MNYNLINFNNFVLYLYYQADGIVALSRGPIPRYNTATLQSSSPYSDALAQYFLGNQTRFDVPLVPAGTPFQNAVWDILKTIPFGSLWTYKDVALALGDGRKVRAVANAIGKNPYTLFVPCHRVIGSDGALHGYAGGVDLKAALITLEKEHYHET